MSAQKAKKGVPTHGQGFCDYIAYFVHEGILYSMKPYAIYDNTGGASYENGYELQVLKQVLNSFTV